MLPPPSGELFYGGPFHSETVIKADLDDLSRLNNSGGYGGDIYSIAVDDTHIYVGGYGSSSSARVVRKYLKSNLSYIGATPSYGGTIRSIAVDDTYIYVGGDVTQTVRKYLKSNLSYIGATPSYGGNIESVDTYIYVRWRIEQQTELENT